ncbi:MAG: hypothetical protein LAO05_09350 [Acidobacteriia bacterium]|nr:hypothetical protein [Terriglobia bacterium]
MSNAFVSWSQIGSRKRPPRRRAFASVLVPVLVLGTAVAARQAPGAEQASTSDPVPAADAAKRPLSLKLGHLLDDRAAGHAEFNLSARRAIWEDPTARLGFALEREEAAARRGGMVGQPVPLTASRLLIGVPGPDPRLVLAGPFAADWQELSTGEKIGRIAETAVTYGIIFEILRGLSGGPRK